MSNSSNDSRPAKGMTISPSSTNCLARNWRSASTRSGKYLASGWPDFDCSSILSPSRNARQRNPSHFGSYCHWLPRGISGTERASIGGNGDLISSGMQNLSQIEAAAQRQQRLPQIAYFLDSRRHVPQMEVFDLDSVLDFRPRYRSGGGRLRVGSDRIDAGQRAAP